MTAPDIFAWNSPPASTPLRRHRRVRVWLADHLASRLRPANLPKFSSNFSSFGLDVKKHLLLSSTSLKLIAVVTMLVDHIGMLFFPKELLFRVIGRMSFPIFAFLIAEGFEKTSNERNYLFRLLALAVISQIPYDFFIRASGVSSVPLNIFFTLSAGLLSLIALKRLPHIYSIPVIAFILLISKFASFDYGVYGVLTVLASSLFIRYRTAGAISLFSLPLFRTILEFFWGTLTVQLYAMLTVPILMLYNGEYGRRFPRLFFYGFYPVHLFVLWLLWFSLN